MECSSGKEKPHEVWDYFVLVIGIVLLTLIIYAFLKYKKVKIVIGDIPFFAIWGTLFLVYMMAILIANDGIHRYEVSLIGIAALSIAVLLADIRQKPENKD